MDVIKIGTAALLVVAFAGALLVRDDQSMAANAAVLPDICGGEHAGHGASAAPADMSQMAAGMGEAHEALFGTMEPMHSDMMRGMSAPEFETAFVCGMLPHHKGAVDMALVAQKYATDPWIKMFAQEIIVTQQAEIREMQGWLDRK
ncbi:DUF305 domain-containing protein [Devosia submarina]|uniref:DUF305 domain-containing protein n=1 Tax=Devosia submarina TaxID=1173082 RepID=UPI000D33AD52|nr:DUF305 domain-containing protein [Devosia submarina]